jgi:hypothetical protein
MPKTRNRSSRVARHKAPAEILGSRGMSVYRSPDYLALDPLVKRMRAVLGGLAVRERGIGMEKPAAVSLLGSLEVLRQHRIGSVPTQYAIDALYWGVPSLRRKIIATPRDVHLFGFDGKGSRSIAVLFDGDTAQKLRAEREEILEVLGELGGGADTRAWSPEKFSTPHVSIGNVPTSLAKDIDRKLLRDIATGIPSQVVLNRATLNNPRNIA